MGPRPFRWVERDAADYPYDGRRAAPRGFTVRPGLPEVPFDTLEAYRDAWWSRLAGDGPDGPSPAPVLALFDEPLAPDAAPRRPLAAPAPTAATISAEARFLARLDARGAAYAALGDALDAALARPAAPADLEAAWAATPEAYLCATGLALQFAGVHAGQPLEDAFRGAAWQTLLAVSLAARLFTLGLADAPATAEDALTVAAHVSRWAAHAEAGGVA